MMAKRFYVLKLRQSLSPIFFFLFTFDVGKQRRRQKTILFQTLRNAWSCYSFIIILTQKSVNWRATDSYSWVLQLEAPRKQTLVSMRKCRVFPFVLRVGVCNKKVKRQRCFWHNGVFEKCNLLARESSLIKVKAESWERGGMGRNNQENWAESEE